jgi:transglutaminase-like putative cysteine protease
VNRNNNAANLPGRSIIYFLSQVLLSFSIIFAFSDVLAIKCGIDLIIISVVASVIYAVLPQKKIPMILFYAILSSAIIIFIVMNLSWLVIGFKSIVNNYIDTINEYQLSTISKYSTVPFSSDELMQAVHTVFSLFVIIITIIASVSVKNLHSSFLSVFLFLPPVMLGIFNGNLPKLTSLMLLIISFIVTHSLAVSSFKSGIAAAGIAVISTLVISFIVVPSFSTSRISSLKQSIRVSQESLFGAPGSNSQGNVITNVISSLKGQFAGNAVSLQNEEIHYTGKEMMSLETNIKPDTVRMLIKTYSGGFYTGYSWEEYAGFSEFNSSLNDLSFQNGNIYSNNSSISNISILRTGYMDDYMPVPYFFENTDQIFSEQDFYYRNTYLNPIQFRTCNGIISSLNPEVYFDRSSHKCTISAFLPSSYNGLSKKYSDYVNNTYMLVPDTIRADIDSIFSNTALSFSSLSDVCSVVTDTLSSVASYNLSPPEMPNGSDFCDYFLRVNKSGYCQHFATAGVMMFRYFGIPARYAVGYSVPSSDFNGGKLSDGSSGFVCSVKDDMAHAWVEIYISNLGWVPVDVTPLAGSAANTVSSHHSESTVSNSAASSESELSSAYPSSSPAAHAASTSGNTYSKAVDFIPLIVGVLSPILILIIIYFILTIRSNVIIKYRMNPKNFDFLISSLMEMLRYSTGDKKCTDADFLRNHRKEFVFIVNESDFVHFTEVVEKYEFSPDKLSEDEKKFIRNIYRSSVLEFTSKLSGKKSFYCTYIKCY